MESIKIAVIGDYDQSRPSHVATTSALHQTSAHLSADVFSHWVPTAPLDHVDNLSHLLEYDGIWGAPGPPDSSVGVTNAIQVARENDIAYLGT